MSNSFLQQRNYWYATLLVAIGMVLIYASCKKTDSGQLSSQFTIMPNSGPAGNLVTITGSGFSTDITQDSVEFNGMGAQVVNVTSTQLQVYAPLGVTTGPVTVFVGARSARGPVYTVSSVSVSAVSPGTGIAGDSVTITGVGLSTTGSLETLAGFPVVKFNGKAATVVSATPTQVVALVPNKADPGPVTVTIGGATATGPVFNYLGIDTLYPLTGNVGTVITMTGGFGTTPGQDTVTLNGVKMVIDSSSPTKMVVTVAAKSSNGTVVVRTAGRPVVGPVFSLVPLPTVASIAPASGPAGIKVTITGTGFSKNLTENSVSFSGKPGTVVSISPTQLVATAPTGVVTGNVSVTVNSQVAKGPVFTAQGLGISSLSSVDFVPLFTDTIYGVGFSATSSQDIVQFNGKAVTVISASDTQLVVSLPAGITSGTASVQVGALTAISPAYSTIGVGTLAGSGVYGLVNGQGSQAEFASPGSMVIDGNGNLFVTDNNQIREVTQAGVVTTFAGDPGGSGGLMDGQGTAARFNNPVGLAIDPSGNLYVADQYNNAIREITPGGLVSTIITALPSGNSPNGVAVDGSGNIYVTDGGYGVAVYYEFNAAGTLVNTVSPAVVSNNPFNSPSLGNLVVDGMGNVYSSDDLGTIYKGAAVFYQLAGGSNKNMTFDNSGNLIFSDQMLDQIYALNPANKSLTLITGGAGIKGQSGYQDGPLGQALFYVPAGVGVDANGIIYVADVDNRVIRKISLH